MESNTDDWNGYRESLAKTGATIAGILLAIVAFGAIGVALMGARRKDRRPLRQVTAKALRRRIP